MMDINTLLKTVVLSVFLWMFVFLHHVGGQTVVEGFVGGSVILPCTLTPNGDLSWKQGTTSILIKPAGDPVIIGDGPYKGDVSLVENSANLKINRLDRIRDGDSGGGDNIFECAYIGSGGERQQIQLSLLGPVVYQDQSRLLMWTEGEIQTISVPFYTYSDTPDVKVVWEKSGESTVLTSHREETGRVRLMIRGQNISIEGTVTVLTLRNVTQSDEGNYTVTVTNDINSASKSNQITITVYVTPHSTLLTTNKPGLSNPDERESDVIFWAAVGGGIAGLVAVIIIVTLSVLLCKKNRMKQKQTQRPPEKRTVAQFNNGPQEVGGLYQESTINPDYEAITENQPYETLGGSGRDDVDYEQCDDPVK